MALNPSNEVFITCAVTGSGATTARSGKVPVTPEQIAGAAIEAARAGAAVVHCHVRDPRSGAPARDPALFREVVARIRDSETDVVINLTAGMGGDLTLGPVEQPLPPLSTGTDMAGATERLAHVSELLPEICTLDCGTMNFGEGDYVMTNTPAMLQAMAARIQALGVRPEIEVFDSGHLELTRWLAGHGFIDDPVLVQICMGIPWGAPDDLNTLLAMINSLPRDWIYSTFSIGRHQLPYVAAAILCGANIRVGLEDNLYLERGVLASNAQLVERAVCITEAMNVKVLGPKQVRDKLKLVKR